MANLPVARVPVPATVGEGAFEMMKRQAVVLSKTELVTKALQGKPESIMLIGLWGAEHGVPLITAVQEVHVIENRPSPSAQLRLALIRRAGHEVRFAESSAERAVLLGRRREYRDDPGAWVTVTYTIGDARKAELLDQWVERWTKAPGAKYDKKETWKVGDDTGPADLTGAPGWVGEEIAAGRVRSKDNWRKYPGDMLRARAAAVLCRMEFSDVMAALAVDPYSPEEHGIDVGQDLDEPAEDTTHPSDENDDAEEVEDADVVDEPATGPDRIPAGPAPGGPQPEGDAA